MFKDISLCLIVLLISSCANLNNTNTKNNTKMIEYSKEQLASNEDLYERTRAECRLAIRKTPGETCLNVSKVTADKYKKILEEEKLKTKCKN